MQDNECYRADNYPTFVLAYVTHEKRSAMVGGGGKLLCTWNEVERQVHDISNQCLGAETLEGVLENLSQSLNGISARLELSAFTDEVGSVPGNQGAVKGVQEGILHHKVPGEERNDRRALVQDEHCCGEDCERSVDESHERELRHVGEEKHARHHSDRQRHNRGQLLKEGLPKAAMAQEVEDSLEY